MLDFKIYKYIFLSIIFIPGLFFLVMLLGSQLKKEKMDKEANPDGADMINGEGYVVTDRNSLLEKLKGLDK